MFSTNESRAKVERARIHLSDLYSRFYGFLDGVNLDIPLSIHSDVEAGQLFGVVESLPIMPQDIGPLIGDIIHNYRSGLDYFWWQLAVRKLGRVPVPKEERNIQFPIFSDAHQWGTHRYFNHVEPEDVEFLIPLQPFKFDERDVTKYSALRIMNELSNHDKHRSLVPIITMMVQARYENISDRPIVMDIKDLPEKIVVGTEVIRATLDLDGVDIDKVLSRTFHAYLSVHNSVNIFAALESIDELCDYVLSEAEKRF